MYAIWHSPLVRSQLTLDDVDFTVLIATSVLGDLSDKCPPADSCRDAFVRMSKATISMVMSTTGFGNASTLGSQPLNSPGGYFKNLRSPQQSPGASQTQSGQQMPQFDVNLRDLFSDEELANRPPTYRRVPAITMPQQSAASSPVFSEPAHALARGFTTSHPEPGMQSTSGPPPQQDTQARQSYHMPDQQSYQQPFTESTMAPGQTDFSLDNLDFLDTLPENSSGNNLWGNVNEFEFGFGTGGMGYDGNASWEANGGVDLFDGFFFGNPGNGL